MANLSNVVGYQLVWFASVIGAARAYPWLGIVSAGIFVCLQGYASRNPKADMFALMLALALGIVIDGGLMASGLLRYAAPQPAALAPLWILAIWASFGLTINHSLAFIVDRPAIAAVLGAIGAPLAYLAAARGFGAIAFAETTWTGLVALGSAWALVMYLFGQFRRRFVQKMSAEIPR